MNHSDEKEIALAIPRGPHHEIFVEGVLRFAAKNGKKWSYISAPESLSLSILDLAGWPGDGILTALKTQQEVRAAESSKCPVVNVSSVLPSAAVPSVIVDNAEIGRLAAEHLIDRRFQTLAFYGLKQVLFSEMRLAGFREVAESSGMNVETFLMQSTYGNLTKVWAQQHRELAQWIEGLPSPCGIFAVTDYRARQVIDACRHLGRRIPAEIGVIGVDNEQVVCEHCEPTLSSVARNDLLHGLRSAALLDCLMNGEEAASDSTAAIAAVGVVERQSTSGINVSDPRLQQAIDFMEANLGEEEITIDSITRHINVSRRWLEYAFRDVFDESPYQYLRRQRLIRVRLLLHEAGDSISDIAKSCGFSSNKQLSLAFRSQFGMTPQQYRKSLTSESIDNA